MDKSSHIFKRGFSLRLAFTLTNLVILTVGTSFAIIVLGSVIQSKRATVEFHLAKELAVSGSRVDTIFDDARSTVRGLILGMPLVLDRDSETFIRWMKIQAELHLPRNPALFDLYFAFAEKPARRLFKSPGMAFAITRNLDYFSSPTFETSTAFRIAAFTDPSYQTDPKEIWYRGAIEAPGMFRTPFYFDTTYFHRVMISITQALHDSKTGEILGVAGVDLTAARFGRLLAEHPIGGTGGVFLADADGQPLAPFMGRDIPMLGFVFSPEMIKKADFEITTAGAPRLNCRPGVHQFKDPKGVPYVYEAAALREPGFCIVAYQKQSEAYAGLYWAIAFISIFSVSVLFISLFFRQALARFVIDNIGKILKNINANRARFAANITEGDYIRLEPEGPREIAQITHQLNLLYQRLQLAFSEIREEKDRAELATKEKSRFLSVMSHEIRTPLNAMLGLTDVLLLSSPLNSEQACHLRVLQHAGQSLLKILNNILDFSRLEAGKLQIEIQEFDLFELLFDVETLMRHDAEAKGLRLTIAAPTQDYRLSGDAVRIRQMLLNLVGNAIKFTTEGSIEIRVTSLGTEGDGVSRFRFEVTDSGIGMTADQQAKVFSEYAQADASITRRYGGTGLGLAITRQIAGLLGGTISVTSELGKGSSFQFVIPLRVLSERKADYRENSSRNVTLSEIQSTRFDPTGKLPILVVDDDEDNHRLIDAYVHLFSGVRAVHAHSAKEALDQLRENHFGLVMMDMQMPDMDGLDATAEIRRLEREGAIPRHPIVMVSANTFAEDRQKSFEAGADQHLSKPIKLDQFRDMLRRWLPTA